MGKDRQGKMRGKCDVEGCDCEEFNSPERGVKCAACTHVPVKHVLLDDDTGQGGGGSAGPRVHPHPPGHAPCRSCQEAYPADALGLCPRCHPRHECRNAGCMRPAYFSPAFYAHGAFGYCSPNCRDKDLVDSGKAVQASMDSLSQLREHYRATLQRDMSRRGGAKVERGGGWQPRSSSTESTEMEIEDNRMKAGSSVGTRPLPTNELGKDSGYSGTGMGRDDPAPKKAKRGVGKKYGGCEASSGEERRVSNVLQIDLGRQASKRLGLVFHHDQQHGLVVTGMDINVIYKSCQLQLLDVVTEVDGKPASVQQFEKMRVEKKGSSKLKVIRNPLRTLSCADIDVKDWSGGKRKGPKPCVFLMAIQLLSSQRKAGTLGAILGVDLQDNRVVRLNERSVAADHGVMGGDVIIGAGVLPVGKMGGKVPSQHWSSEEVAAQLAQTCDEGQVFVCVLERLTDRE